jgi:hypothetical protein
MAKHALVFVHGMGEYSGAWHTPAWAVLRTAFSEYESFRGKILDDFVTPIPTIYSDLFAELRKQWKDDASAIKVTLGNQIDSDDKAERARVEKEVDNIADKIGAGSDTFVWTHAMDVVLYRFFKLIRQAVNVSLAKQIVDKATGMDFNSWSVMAHSLGTAVAHNTLHSLYNTPLISGQSPLQTVETRPKMLAMVANVSRVLQLPGLKVYESKVCPGSALVGRVCQTYLNIRHQWDPFTIPQPFKPDPGWPDAATFNSTQYQHIQPSHLLLQKYMEVHDLDHYLKNPRVHVPIFRSIFGEGIIPQSEFETACHRFDSAVVGNNVNDIRDELDKLLPAGSDSWPTVVRLLFKLFDKGTV